MTRNISLTSLGPAARAQAAAQIVGDEKKRSKYGNERTTVDGITFASKKEARRYGELRMLERQKIISDLKLQRRFRLEVNGILIATYVADFDYGAGPDGHIVEDCKGVRTPLYRVKKKLMLALYGVEIIET